MKLWLDDLRRAPSGFEHARSVDEAKEMIKEAEKKGEPIDLLDLDYDMGIFEYQGGTGMDLLVWLLDRETFYPVEIHTSDFIAEENMAGLLETYWP